MSDDQLPAVARRLRIAVDLDDLETALEEVSWEATWYLDLETGRLVRVDAETRHELEEIDEEVESAEGSEPVEIAEMLGARDLPEWRWEALVEADEVERGLGGRFIVVPRADSWQDYADLEDFIATVEEERLQARLFEAIQGRGAFGRFRDTLLGAPAERERWFAFKADRTRERALAWLESEGIEPIFSPNLEQDRARASSTLPARVQLIAEVVSFARAASQIPGVIRIALLGSLTTTKPDPKDADLLVTVADEADLAPLADLGRKLRGHAQSLNRGVDVFLADSRGSYLGRTCPWKRCGPGIRLSCDARHCGRRLYLHDDLATVKLPQNLIAAPPVELWPAIVVRVTLPADLEQALANLRWD